MLVLRVSLSDCSVEKVLIFLSLCFCDFAMWKHVVAVVALHALMVPHICPFQALGPGHPWASLGILGCCKVPGIRETAGREPEASRAT